MADDKPVVLTSVANDMMAAPILAALEAAGIRAESTGGFTADFRAEAPGTVRILVRESNLSTARQILESLDDESTEVDWSQVDVGEPEDPSNN